MTGRRPRIAITLGDPAGVGPEIVVRAWPNPEVHAWGSLIVVGDSGALQRAAREFAPQLEVETGTTDPRDSSPALLRCEPLDRMYDFEPGVATRETGRASLEAIERAARMALHHQVDGIVTCPISKVAWSAAGCPVPGHTELLARICGIGHSAMMLYLPNSVIPSPAGLGVVHATLHTSLRQALAELRSDLIVEQARLLDGIMRRFLRHQGVTLEPRIALCALNPHAGEEGLFGDEEYSIIAPAAKALRDGGLPVVGPLPADTLLARAVQGDWDGVVAMYHDQGHIAIKLVRMFAAVNITLGLPIVRTSVAHGTAFDIAWKGVADTEGLVSAIRTCAMLCGDASVAK